MKNWVLIYRTENLPRAAIIRGMLEENNIPVSVINKQDSSYLNFGEIELYVPGHLQHLAKSLLSKALTN